VTIQSIPDGIQVISGKDGALPLTLKMADASVTQFNELYSDFYLPEEAARGLQASDTHVHVADFEAVIGVGHTIILLASAEGNPQIDQDAFARRQQYEQALLEKWMKQQNISSVDTISDDERQLVFAADQFVVKRIAQNQPDGRSIIAGYPWFEDWGRDTMIGLTGLTLLTGRQQEASLILATFAQYISNGMLPNRFPDTGDIPQYNTIDATLWYFHAIRSYYEATHDLTLIRDLFPKLKDIIDWHVKGTRFNIHMDPNDHLIEGGQDGVQLTWMDALVNGIVITPRIGKPVEVNALWYNALNSMVIFARILGESPAVYQTMADAAKKGFARFWNDEKGYLFDVLDGPNGNEDILRPNQILAVSLPDCPLTTAQQQKVVNICAEQLWTSVGLRSLAPLEKDYKGFYGGDQTNRDSAYHQGTVWSWLIGPFIKAHIAVYQDTEAASRFLDPLFDHFTAVGIGTISEIFDGDAPFNPKGCIAQAWSIGQMLEAYVAIQQLKTK
jgi:glycogen debranching enzyme